jgi:hypothetical protein
MPQLQRSAAAAAASYRSTTICIDITAAGNASSRAANSNWRCDKQDF